MGDDCSSRDQVQLSSDNKNIGDLLNAKNVSWGYFQGGFKRNSSTGHNTAASMYAATSAPAGNSFSS